MKTTIKPNSLAKIMALLLIVAYPLTACSDSGKEGKGKNKGEVKATVFKILNKYTPTELGEVKTIILLGKDNELIYVLAKDGEPAGRGTLGKLLKKNEKLVSSKSLNIIETIGSHHFYYCDAGGNCIKFNYPH